jgi:hypothetical protein
MKSSPIWHVGSLCYVPGGLIGCSPGLNYHGKITALDGDKATVKVTKTVADWDKSITQTWVHKTPIATGKLQPRVE